MSSLARLVGRGVLGAAVMLLVVGLMLAGFAAYLLARPYARLGRQGRLLAMFEAAQAILAVAGTMRPADGGGELVPDETGADT